MAADQRCESRSLLLKLADHIEKVEHAYAGRESWELVSAAGVELDDFCSEHANELIAALRSFAVSEIAFNKGGFARAFGTGDDQVVVIMQAGDEGPELRAFAQPKGLGVCSIAVSYTDDDAGWDKCEEQFALIDESRARWMIEPLLKQAKEMVNG